MSDPIEEQVSRLEDQHEPGERVKALQEWLDVELAPHRDDDGIVRVPGDRWCDILLTLLEEVARIEADAYERGRQDQHRATAEACAEKINDTDLLRLEALAGEEFLTEKGYSALYQARQDHAACETIRDAPPPGLEEGKE